MGRRSIAEKICLDIDTSDPRRKNLKLVIYDFASEKIPSKFFDNLKRVFGLMQDGWMLQYSAVAAERMSTVLAVAELARHYGCKSVRVYVVEEWRKKYRGQVPPKFNRARKSAADAGLN